MRVTAIARAIRPTLVTQYASPTSGGGGGVASSSSGTSPSRRPRRPPTGVASEVGLAAASLLPPRPLLRRILRIHRTLPLELKSIGDAYVKDEFHRHANIDNPLQIVGFLTQWKQYLDNLESQPTGPTPGSAAFRGKKLDAEQFEKLSDDQLYQLHELMNAAREVYDPEKAQAQPPGGNKAVNEAVEEALRRTTRAFQDDKDKKGGGKE